eukprot:COSAG01_NODE_2024_length_8608_cov_32.124574_2_plen_63_part_00
MRCAGLTSTASASGTIVIATREMFALWPAPIPTTVLTCAATATASLYQQLLHPMFPIVSSRS